MFTNIFCRFPEIFIEKTTLKEFWKKCEQLFIQNKKFNVMMKRKIDSNIYLLRNFQLRNVFLHSPQYYILHNTTFSTILHSPQYHILHYTTFSTIPHSPQYYILHNTTFSTILHSPQYYSLSLTTIQIAGHLLEWWNFCFPVKSFKCG